MRQDRAWHPAAAPLGSDAEAGGAPPTPDERQMALAEASDAGGDPVDAADGGGVVVNWRAFLFGALLFLLTGGVLVSLRLP